MTRVDATEEIGAAMAGFDPRWADPAAYILGVTREIWEDRGIATLQRSYAADIPVRSPGGVSVGRDGVIAATMATLAEFPDRFLLGEDVIWSLAEEGGFLSSHRILSTATHAGDGVFGPATGKRLQYRVIADCAARADQIYDEWLVRDLGAIVRQMGWEPKHYGAGQIADEGGPDRSRAPAADVAGPYRGAGNDHPVGHRYADLLGRIMAADLATVARDYDRAAQLELPGGVTGHGHAPPIASGWACAPPSPMQPSSSTTASAAPTRCCRPAPPCAGRSPAVTAAGAASVHPPAPRFMSWASATPNSGRGGCGANTCCSTRSRSGSRSCCTPADARGTP